MTRWLLLLMLPLVALATEQDSDQAVGDKTTLWLRWQYSRPLLMPLTASTWTQLTLPPEIYGMAQPTLADLRLIDEGGKEIPYLLYARQEQCQRAWRTAPISDIGFTPGQYSQAIIDAGSEASPHNAVEIETGEKNFFTWVEISSSEDRTAWRIVREKAPFYRFDDGKANGGEILSYPLTHSRWLRLRFLRGEKTFLPGNARIAREARTEAEYVPLAASFQLETSQPEQESLWRTDLGRMLPPISALRLESSQAEFHRGIRVDVSEDGKKWRNIAHGHLYRHASGEDAKQRAMLEISFTETQARFWRIGILNRNDPALPELQLKLLSVPRHLAFKHTTGRNYRLLYGNPRTTPAQYELARISRKTEWQPAPLATLGREAVTTAYTSAEPWSERHPWLLWTALVTAVVVLAGMALNALRHGNTGSGNKTES